MLLFVKEKICFTDLDFQGPGQEGKIPECFAKVQNIKSSNLLSYTATAHWWGGDKNLNLSVFIMVTPPGKGAFPHPATLATGQLAAHSHLYILAQSRPSGQ